MPQLLSSCLRCCLRLRSPARLRRGAGAGAALLLWAGLAAAAPPGGGAAPAAAAVPAAGAAEPAEASPQRRKQARRDTRKAGLREEARTQRRTGTPPEKSTETTPGTHSDMPAAVSHEMHRLQALALQGAELRERGEPEAALALLQRGHDEMLRRDRDGPGLQAYLDGLRLQAEYGMTLIALGRASVGEEFIATARRTVDLAYARRELEPPQGPGAPAPLVASALRGGEELETQLAAFYAARVAAPPPGLDARQASERMSEAYRRAETWVLRGALAGRGGAAGGRLEASALQRVAALRLGLARGLLAAGRGPEAAAEFVAAAALGCGAGGRAGARSGCERASQGWAEAAGAAAAGEAGRWQQALGFDAAGALTSDP